MSPSYASSDKTAAEGARALLVVKPAKVAAPVVVSNVTLFLFSKQDSQEPGVLEAQVGLGGGAGGLGGGGLGERGLGEGRLGGGGGGGEGLGTTTFVSYAIVTLDKVALKLKPNSICTPSSTRPLVAGRLGKTAGALLPTCRELYRRPALRLMLSTPCRTGSKQRHKP